MIYSLLQPHCVFHNHKTYLKCCLFLDSSGNTTENDWKTKRNEIKTCKEESI